MALLLGVAVNGNNVGVTVVVFDVVVVFGGGGGGGGCIVSLFSPP